MMKLKMKNLADKGVLRFGLGVAVAATISIFALSTATAQPIMGKTPIKMGYCGDVCASRLYVCLRAGGDPMPCYISYYYCNSGCNTGAFREPAPTP